VHGRTADGRAVDEVSLMGPTMICKSGVSREPSIEEIRPEDFGFQSASIADLQGGDAKTNAAILEAILAARETGPKRDIVLMNAGAALACSGIAKDMSEGIRISLETIASGAALDRLQRLRKASQHSA
jgi:anthranilate phosphoribosyltransferase